MIRGFAGNGLVVEQMTMVAVTAFYHFVALAPDAEEALAAGFERLLAECDAKGLVLVAPEGFNGTVSLPPDRLDVWKQSVADLTGVDSILFKDSSAPDHVFGKAKVDRRPEIVGAGRPGVFPESPLNHHLTPQEWDRVLRTESSVLLVDTRNEYEVRIGRFEGAVDPGLRTFTQWDEWVGTHPIAPDTKVLMYCTGGIRCEKAILSMQERGIDNVWQLQGGILGYLAEYPDGGLFDGECFVFDERVAVDASLAPTERWLKCPHCGDPADRSDVSVCPYCGGPGIACAGCRAIAQSGESPDRAACSRGCAYHVRRGTTPRRRKTKSPR